ncbi:MAG: NPCBM/NEW2 domain-containing protein [Micromonosporaceae bacterium]
MARPPSVLKRSVLKRLVVPLAAVLAAGFLTHGGAAAAAPADQSLGDVTGFTADGATYTFEAGTAKVRVIFQRDDVFRLWLAPDGEFTDPANADPSDPAAPDADIVVKHDYAQPATTHVETDDSYQLRTGKITLTATKSPLSFSLHRADGTLVWSETSPLSWNDTSTRQHLARGANEQFLGGGMQNGRFSHRGQTIKIERNFNWTDGGHPNASPYYMSSAGYGVLRNTFASGAYTFTAPVRAIHREKRFDAYYFVGDFKTSLDRYTELTGRPFLPPIYGLEYGDSDCYNRGHYGVDPDSGNDWKTHPDKQTTLDAVKVAQKFVDEDMPRGWMLVNDDYGCGYSDDLGYELVNGTYWGKREIGALTTTGDELRRRGTQMGLWTESSLDRQADEVGTAGVRVRKLDVAWVGPGYRHALTACEDAYDGIEEHSDARGYAWMVEGWAGAQRCAVMWTGDHGGTLDNIKWQIPAIHGSGNSGIAYAAGDVDGIFGGTDVSYTRDMQWKVFNPAFMTMSGWANPAYKQPWSRGEPYTAINRKYLKLRERLLPFFYSYAAEAHRTGAPINRSLPIEYPNDPNAYGATHEFLAGQEFLVAPMWDEGETKNGIYLPEGMWIDYWTGKVYQGPATINGYHAPLDRLPLFAKAGAVVPMFKAGINGHAEHKPGDRLSVDVYPLGRSDFQLYEDDRLTRAHRSAASAIQNFEVDAPDKARGDVVVRIGESTGSYAGKPSTRPYELTVHTGTKPGAVALGDKALPALDSKDAYDAASSGWFYAANDRGGVVYVKTPSIATGSTATVTLSGTTSVGGGERVDDTLGVVAADVPALFQAPGQATSTTVSFRNGSAAPMRNVALTVGTPDGWTAGTKTYSKVDPGKTVTATVPVTPGAAVRPASYTLRPKASYLARDTRHTTTAAATAVIPYGSVADAYNTVGIADANTYRDGNLDGAGNSLAGELLAEKGYTPGATVTVNGASFTWPAAAPGTPNTVKNVNHPILVSGRGSHLALLGTGVNTRATGTVTVLYTDGTSSSHSLTYPNWSFQDATTGGAKLAVSTKGRYTPDGLANTEYDYRVFYNTVELKPGKTVRAVTLPATNTIGIFAATVHDRPLPPVPKGEAYVSDLEFLEATNGWGPVERDRSNGESAGGDGAAITLNGVTYDKGLGAHAISNVKVHTGKACTRFTAKVGVDDEMADRGSIQFKVIVDGVTKYTSPVMTGNSATVDVDVDVTGGTYVELYIGDGGNGIGSDHGDWADAKLTCAP